MHRLSGLPLGLMLLLAGPAWALEPCAPEGPWVEVAVEGKGSIPPSAYLSRLRVGLEPLGIGLCARGNGPERPPAARLSFVTNDERRMEVRLVVEDHVTVKQVARVIDLSSSPRDSRPLLLAVSAEELLRASWAELALDRQEPPAAPPPKEVVNAVDTKLKVRPEFETRALSVAAGASGTLWTRGQAELGPELRFGVAITPVIELGFDAGYRWGAEFEGVLGDASLSQSVFGMDVRYRLSQHEPLRTWVGLHAGLGLAQATAVAAVDASATDDSAWATWGGLHAVIDLALTERWRLAGQARAQRAQRGVLVAGDEVLGGIGGWGVGLYAGARHEF